MQQVDELLAAAVVAVNGTERPGQVEMAHAVADAIGKGEHLLVQAGTGTGKSLAYLVPALLHDEPVIIATATIALQRQLVDRDLPRLLDAVEPILERRPTFAMLKGRSNYLCLHRLNTGSDDADQEALFDPTPSSRAGRDAVRIRAWAEHTKTGDRDEISPAPDERAWRSLSVTPHECLGATKCPFGESCFAELARERAREADVVVTNHAMLAIDALSDARLLPEHDVVIVDEGHELADRATGAVTDELTAAMVERAARRARRFAGERDSDLLLDAAELLTQAFEESREGRIDELRGALFDALVGVRDAGHAALTAIGSSSSKDDPDELAGRTRARAAVEEVHEIAGRIVAAGDSDVVWLTRSERRPPSLWRAPLFVGGLLRETLFGSATVVMTSATLTLGGDFDAVARSVGLVRDELPAWRGLDAGSPFDYQRQAILYIASHLPPPGRDGLSDAFLDELAELVTAAGGRTLGLFSSMRAAQQAADAMRERLDLPILCQGDDATGELVRKFAADAATCLFGTLSLWQGVDVPGSALQLVVIDRLPFPRPDDPLASARQRAVEAAGGNGFLAVAATQAALRLAQGSGRLIRRSDDRGVVAVLDSRLSNARYGSFVRRSMPDFWTTTDPELARRSLATIDEQAPDPLPVPDRVWASDDDPGKEAPPEPDKGGRQRRRWTDAEQAQLLSGFALGTPVGLLADELGRTPSAIVTRLRQAGVTSRLIWGGGEEVSHADRELGYALTAVPVPLLTDPDALVDALSADGWEAEVHDDVVTVTRGDVAALVGWEDPTHLLMGDATSRWLIARLESCPPGPNAVIVPAQT